MKSNLDLIRSPNPYNNAVDKTAAVVIFITAVGAIFLNWIKNTAWAFAEIFVQVLFGWVRGVLISSFLIALLGVAIMDNHQQAMESANTLKCANVQFFNVATEVTGLLAERTPGIICFWNFYVSFTSIFLRLALQFFWNCSDISNVLFDFATLLAKIFESIVLFWFKVDSGSFLANRFDFESIVIAAQDLISNLRNPLICACSDLSMFADYFLSVLTDPELAPGIGYAGNAGLSALQVPTQTIINIILGTSNEPPVANSINNVCTASISFGVVIDNAVTNFVTIFWDTFPDSRIGSVLAYAICLITDSLFLFTDSTIRYIWDAAFSGPGYNFITDADLVPLIEHIDSLGICLVYTLTPLQICFAQTVGNAFRFISAILAYVKGVVQDGENNLGLVKTALNRFVGQSSYGGGGHILATDGHDVIRTQTSLTCLIATSLTFGGLTEYTTCGTKFADLVNSVVQLIITPFNILTEILDNRDLLENIDGNPLQADTRDDFEEFFEILFDSILNPIFGVFDYAAHLVGCVPLLGSFANVLQLTVYNLRNIARELRTLLIKLIEFVIQLIVLIITVLGQDVFPDSSVAGEFSIFGQIFIDVFTTLFKLVYEFIKNIFNFTIGAFFPVLFNQPSIYASSYTSRSSPATLTECFDTFGDCTCGIFYVNIGKKVCLPLTDTCLSDIFPSCGLFQTTPEWESTSRKRFTGSNPYDTPFEYLAGEFPNGVCGEVFRTFADYGKDERGYLKRSTSTLNGTLFHEKSVPSLQATSFFGCLDRLMKSFELSQQSNWTIPVDYYIQDSRFVESTTEIVRGSGMIFFEALVDSISMYNYPEYVAGLPTPDVPETPSVYTATSNVQSARSWLYEKGVEDPLALEFLAKSSSTVMTGLQKSRLMFNQKSRELRKEKLMNPYVKILDTSSSLISTAMSTALLIAKETLKPEIIPHLVDGTIDAMQWAQTVNFADVFPEPKKRDHLQRRGSKRKRDHSDQLGGVYFPSDEPNYELNELDDLVITSADRAGFKIGNVVKGGIAAGRQIFGAYLELLARRDMTEEQFADRIPLRINRPRQDQQSDNFVAKEDILSPSGFYHYAKVNKRNLIPHIYALNMTLPDSLVGNEILNFHPDVSYLYGMGGMIDFQHHIPFSCVSVRGYCDDNLLNGCDETLYFQTLGLCSSFLGGFGIVSQCGEDFQAIAIYETDSCDGAPLRLAVATAANPIRCIRFSVNPTGPENDYFCVEYDQCTSCPVKKLIPNLECEYLYEFAHRQEYNLEYCWVELVGPIYPPFNFTSSLPTVTEPLIIDPVGNYVPIPTPTPGPTSTCTSVCGDRIKSNEVDQNGRLCEECDDGNTRDGDGCDGRCRRERCPRWRLPDFPVAPGTETPATCSTGTIPFIQSRRTSRYCHSRNIVIPPYTGKVQSTDIAYDSLQVICSGRNPVISEYTTQDCTGFSVSRSIRKNCSQEGTVDLMYYQVGDPAVLQPALSIRVGTDVTCQFKCGLCGDGAVQGPEQCDNNPFSNPACTYCVKTEAVCDNPSVQFCQGVCAPLFGEIPVDSRYGVQAPSFCQSLYNINPIVCPAGHVCRYYSVQNLVKKRDEILVEYNGSLVEDVLRMASQLAERDIAENEAVQAQKLQENQRRAVHVPSPVQNVQQLRPQSLFTLQSSPVKDNFMHLFAKKLVNDVVDLFTGSSADSYIANIVDWFKRPGIGPSTPPNERGAVYELAFHGICDPILSFNGSLGFGLVQGTLYWLYGALVLVVIFSLAGSTFSSFGVSLLMFVGFATWVRLTFGIAIVGCYITATGTSFRIPQTIFPELYDITKVFNGTCIDFIQPLATSPCLRESCNQTFLNCGDLNYVDGFDSFFGIMEVWLPQEIPQWYRASSTVADAESVLQLLSSQSGYDLYGSYTVAKTNFDFGGVVPHPGHRFCSFVTSPTMAEIPLIVLVALYGAYYLVKITIPLILDIGYATWAFLVALNHIIIIPVQSKLRDYELFKRIEAIRESEMVELKIVKTD